jgi:hypothetical protein
MLSATRRTIAAPQRAVQSCFMSQDLDGRRDVCPMTATPLLVFSRGTNALQTLFL